MSRRADVPNAPIARRWTIASELGRGAVATTYRACDLRSGEVVALKRLHPELRAEAAVVERFRREVELVQRIRHPHVLVLRELVEDGDEIWLIMDYHDGGDLADRVAARGPLAIDDVVALGAQLAGALDAAHAAGVVHRDVKPANVLYGPGDHPDVRLCDFGLARSADVSRLTAADAVVGTPSTMAPETIIDGHADPRSDVYALAVLLHEAATGQLPFRGETPYELMRQHLHESPPPLRSLRGDAPAWLESLLLRALAKDPLDRPTTADELRRSLLAGQAGDEPRELLAAPPSPPDDAGKSCASCGGWLVAAVGVCADCGARPMRLVSRRAGAGVVVTGDDKIGARMALHDHVRLYRVLDEVAPAWAPPPGKRRAPRLPCVVATDLTAESAAELAAKLREAGLQAAVRENYRRDLDFRDKQRSMTKRLFGLCGGLGCALMSAVSHATNGMQTAAIGVVAAGGIVGVTVAVRRSTVRPLLTPPNVVSTSPALARIGDALASVRARHDRRLLARLVGRLGRATTRVGEQATAPVTACVASWAEALVAVDAAAVAQPEEPARPQEQSIAFLRNAERQRAELRHRLLEIAGKLDELLARAALAQARGSKDAVASLRGTLAELEMQIEGRREVAALLGADRP